MTLPNEMDLPEYICKNITGPERLSVEAEKCFIHPAQIDPYQIKPASIGTTKQELEPRCHPPFVHCRGREYTLESIAEEYGPLQNADMVLTRVMDSHFLAGLITANDVARAFLRSRDPDFHSNRGYRLAFPIDFEQDEVDFDVHSSGPHESETATRWTTDFWIRNWFLDAACHWNGLHHSTGELPVWHFWVMWRKKASFLRRMFQLTDDTELSKYFLDDEGIGAQFADAVIGAMFKCPKDNNHLWAELNWRAELMHELKRSMDERHGFVEAFMQGSLDGWDVVWPDDENGEFINHWEYLQQGVPPFEGAEA